MKQVYDAALKYKLTRREIEVLKLAVMGFSTREIGKELGITPGTAKVYLHYLREKMGAPTRAKMTWMVLGYD